MKKMITLMAIVAMLTLTTGYNCFAAPSVPIGVLATVKAVSNGLSAKINQLNTKGTCDPPGSTDDWNGSTVVTSMNFGILEYDPTYEIFSNQTYFAVDAPVIDNSGNIWTITHTRSNFQNTAAVTANLNDNVNVVFKRVKLIEGATDSKQTEEEQLDKVSYTNSNNVIYTKDNLKFATGKQGWLRIYYGIATGDPGLPTGCIADALGTSPIGVDKPAGTYIGSVTLTLTGV